MPSTINFLRLIADPTRLRVLLLLEQEELSVAELQEILGMGQSRISSHLAQLKRAGAVVDRRAGKNVYYGLKSLSRNGARGRVQELVQTLAREIPETARDRTALKLTLRKRQDKAREYFDELAGKFGRSYVPGRSWEALAHVLITLLPPLTVADLGAGEGTLAQLLAKNARKVIAVDNSPKMVELLNHSFERARELFADHWLGFSEVQLHQFLEDSGFKNIDVRVVAREKQNPNFQTVFATGTK